MNWKKKAAASGLGVVFTVAFTETILRGVGVSQKFDRPYAEASDLDLSPNTFRILSLGNSYTFGSGAPPGHSFSDHLQRMVDKENRKTQIRVINRGRGNVNSTYILEALPENLEKLRPNVIALMAGECNVWNRYHYNAYLRRSRAESRQWSVDLRNTIYDWFYSFRTFRLLTMLMTPHLTASTYVTGRYSVAFPGDDVANFSVVGRKWLGGLESGSSFDIYHLTDAQRNEAIATLSAIEAKGEGSREVYATLARLHSLSAKDLEKAAPYYRKSIEASPGQFDFYAYRELTEAIPSSLAKTSELKEEMMRLIEMSKAHYPGDEDYGHLVQWFDTLTLPAKYEGPQNSEKAIRFLELAHRSRLSSVRTARLLANLLEDKNQQARAAEVLMESLRVSPFSPEGDLYGTLHLIGKSSRDSSLKARISSFIAEMAAKYPSEAIRDEKLDDVELAKWIESDLREIIRISRGRGVKVVLQSYAPLRGGGKRIADEVIRRLALEERLPFADNMSEFNAAFRGGLDPEKIYSNEFGPTDSHLNSDGYLKMAEILKRTLEENKLLPQ